MKDVVNDRIKHRERFRPFAGVVPLENVSDYFELDRTSPYMQFVVPVKKEAEDRTPAVVHFGTCRAQTVDHHDDSVVSRASARI
jgi:carbamoyltransferase